MLSDCFRKVYSSSRTFLSLHATRKKKARPVYLPSFMNKLFLFTGFQANTLAISSKKERDIDTNWKIYGIPVSKC